MPETMTRRLAVLMAFKARLELVKTSEGFSTDAGFNVVLGEKTQFGESDPLPAICIVPAPDAPTHNGENVSAVWAVEIQAIAEVDINQPVVVPEQVIGDIKVAIETEDRTLGGLVPSRIRRGSTRTLPREPGSTICGVGITYGFQLTEQWGHP